VKDVIVIGAGIIGATIAKAFTAKGREVLLMDANLSMPGTAPSGGHMRPQWFGNLKTGYEPAMGLLDQTWGVIEEEYLVYPAKSRRQLKGVGQPRGEVVYRVDIDQVLAYPRTLAQAISIGGAEERPVVYYRQLGVPDAETEAEHARLVVVAAGLWSDQLIRELEIKGKVGVSFRIGGHLAQPFIKPWAPYRQIVAHQQEGDKIWVGDGTALLTKSWKPDQSTLCWTRCSEAVQDQADVLTMPQARLGVRPYCETGGDPCLIHRASKRVWAVTGSGKNGTIAAGWAALRLLKEFR
jgi:glycine/D-amino acid oxidase-like deaminating enzyme